MSAKFKQNCRVVLLAEDDLEMRLLLSLALQKNGCSVIECKDGVDLLSKIEPLLNGKKEVEYDLIITDIRMPGLTGMEVVEGLSGLPGCPPIVLITAFGDAETHERASQFGVTAVLEKPFEIEAFLKIVNAVLIASDT
jgi:CheY-like chemotaxis protein